MAEPKTNKEIEQIRLDYWQRWSEN